MRNQIFTHYNVPRRVRSDPSASPQESALRRIGQAPQLAGLASHAKKVESQPECLEVSSKKCRKAVDFCSLWERGVQHVSYTGNHASRWFYMGNSVQIEAACNGE